jgi:hypothetical protein
MRGEFQWLLRNLKGAPEDRDYPDYQARLHFIDHRAREELYDIVKDPGCRHNLANNAEYHTQLTRFRDRMTTLLQQTGDHETKNFQAFLDVP